jgi:putative oxidoreductase
MLPRSGIERGSDFPPSEELIFHSHSSLFAAMKVLTIIARVLLGLMFAVFGANIFLHFIPMPPPKPSLATDFSKALMESGYMYVVGFLQVAGGLLLLIGRFVPLGLTLLGPVIVNILLFHIFLERTGLPMALVVSALALFLLCRYRANFAGLVKP